MDRRHFLAGILAVPFAALPVPATAAPLTLKPESAEAVRRAVARLMPITTYDSGVVSMRPGAVTSHRCGAWAFWRIRAADTH